jgi:hypothetical protein
MKSLIVLVSAWFVMFGTVTGLSAQVKKTGGYSDASVDSKEVKDAAAYAVTAQTKVMQGQKDGKTTQLELVNILSAKQQVVSGMNFRLTLKVKVNGKEKQAEATVWWQSWRKPAGSPYRLTSWKWSDK